MQDVARLWWYLKTLCMIIFILCSVLPHNAWLILRTVTELGKKKNYKIKRTRSYRDPDTSPSSYTQIDEDMKDGRRKFLQRGHRTFFGGLRRFPEYLWFWIWREELDLVDSPIVDNTASSSWIVIAGMDTRTDWDEWQILAVAVFRIGKSIENRPFSPCICQSI